MQENPNIKYRPSLIEENPTLLIWLLLLVTYLLAAVIAKYAWFIRDEQIVEITLWLLLIVAAAFIAIQQVLRAGTIREQAWPKQLPTVPPRGERELEDGMAAAHGQDELAAVEHARAERGTFLRAQAQAEVVLAGGDARGHLGGAKGVDLGRQARVLRLYLRPRGNQPARA